MFEGLDWKAAARRSAVVIAFYLGLFYVLSVAWPKNFGLDSREQVISLLINAAMFFFVFTVVYAFIGRSRERRLAAIREKEKTSARPQSDGRTESGPLKGRPNPHTSRKKTRRRR